jgi:hypothetical protein
MPAQGRTGNVLRKANNCERPVAIVRRSTTNRSGRSSKQRVRCIDPTTDAECQPSSSLDGKVCSVQPLLAPTAGLSLRCAQGLQIFDDRPDFVFRELARERRHVVDLRAQLDGVTVPHLVEQNALGVELGAKFVG